MSPARMYFCARSTAEIKSARKKLEAISAIEAQRHRELDFFSSSVSLCLCGNSFPFMIDDQKSNCACARDSLRAPSEFRPVETIQTLPRRWSKTTRLS